MAIGHGIHTFGIVPGVMQRNFGLDGVRHSNLTTLCLARNSQVGPSSLEAECEICMEKIVRDLELPSCKVTEDTSGQASELHTVCCGMSLLLYQWC